MAVLPTRAGPGNLRRPLPSERGLKLITVDIAREYHETLPQMAARTLRGREKPCSVCGLVKRHILNRVSVEGGLFRPGNRP